MSDIIIQTHQVYKIFHKGKTNEVKAVQDISLNICRNQCVVLKGASGSGKTTLLTILSCLAKPTSGEYICRNEHVTRWSEKFLTDFRRRYLGIVFQHFNLIQGYSVFTNIALPLIPLGYSHSTIAQKVKQATENVLIAHKLQAKVNTLSGGELQRVAIARALVNEPEILLADEPTSHLDSENARHILTIFERLKAEGKTLIFTTHDLQVENHPIVDAKIQMKDGRIVV